MPRRKQRLTTKKDGIIHTYRSAISMGNNIMITLPVQWVRDHDIKPGDKFAMTANSMVSLVKLNKGGSSV